MAILTSLDLDAIARICGAFGVEPVRAEGVLAGSVNTNYRVEGADGATWFLRVYEEQGPEGARREARLLQRLADSDVPTPSPALRADGRGAIVLYEDKACALFPFVRGVHRCQRAVSESDARLVGTLLARVHRVGLAFRAEEALTTPTRFDGAALRARLETIDAESAEIGAARARIESVLAELASHPPTAPLVPLVHGDLFRDNVLFTEGGAVLLDFESASRGAVAFDLAVTALAWCFGDALDLDLARAMGEGYRAERDPTASERADLFDAARLACARFATTRLTDYELRPRGLGVYKDFRRWLSRLSAVERLGRAGFADRFGLG